MRDMGAGGGDASFMKATVLPRITGEDHDV